MCIKYIKLKQGYDEFVLKNSFIRSVCLFVNSLALVFGRSFLCKRL